MNDVRVTGFTIQGFSGAGIVFANTSYGSHDAGFYVGNSPNADFTVRYNTAFADLWGILVRDASTGSVTDNLLRDSCSGLVFLNSGTTTGVHNWRASHNIVAHNDKFCSADEEELPFSLTGLGILMPTATTSCFGRTG